MGARERSFLLKIKEIERTHISKRGLQIEVASQVCLDDDTRVQTISLEVVLDAEFLDQREGKQHVRRFALAICSPPIVRVTTL